MISSIKWKIFFGFLTLTFMLFVAGSVSIYEFITLSKSVNAILDDNYITVKSAVTMLEAVEREDSGILLILNDDFEEGNQMIQQGDASFEQAYQEAVTSVQSVNEKKIIENLKLYYDEYALTWEDPLLLVNIQNDISWYSNKVFPRFNQVKTTIKELMLDNQSDIYREATIIKDKAKRAIMPGIVAILSALTITIIFTYFINKFFVKPLIILTNKVENYRVSDSQIDANIVTQDELKRLETAIQDLVHRLRRK